MRENREKTRRNQRKTKQQGQKQGNSRRFLSHLEFSSHIKGKIMNLECFSIMFVASFACYDKLCQGLWVIKA